MWVATYLKSGSPFVIARHTVPIVLDREIVRAVFVAARDGDGLGVRIDAVLDELRDRLQGLLCESAMIRIAFQSSPIRSLPLSLALCFHAGSL